MAHRNFFYLFTYKFFTAFFHSRKGKGGCHIMQDPFQLKIYLFFYFKTSVTYCKKFKAPLASQKPDLVISTNPFPLINESFVNAWHPNFFRFETLYSGL